MENSFVIWYLNNIFVPKKTNTHENCSDILEWRFITSRERIPKGSRVVPALIPVGRNCDVGKDQAALCATQGDPGYTRTWFQQASEFHF